MSKKRNLICWPLWGCLALGAPMFLAVGADQPQWGQAWSRNMVSEERGLPEGFDPATGRNVKWAVPLGTETYATPVIAGGRVYLGTNNGRPRDPRHEGDRSVLLCLDEETGRLLWQLVVPKLTTSVYWDWPKAGICSPVTVDGDRVYVVSNRGEVMCLDPAGMANGNDGPFRDEARHAVPSGSDPIEPGPADGDILWLFDYIGQCGVRQHDQAHASILVHEGFLYLNTSNGLDDAHRHIDAPDAPSLIVLDKTDGRLVAMDGERIGPRIFHSTWSSPALAVVDGKPQIIFCGGDGVVYAFEPVETAGPPGEVARLKRIWKFDCDPAAPKEEVQRYVRNRQVSPSNVKSVPVVAGNRVYVTVGGDLWWGKHEAWMQCIDAAALTGPGGRGESEGANGNPGLLWSYALERHCMSTPAVHGGLAFAGDSGRRIHCVDAVTGSVCWTHDVAGEIWASPLVADGKVYFASRRGELLTFALNREKKLLSETDVGSPLNSSPVAANGVLYVATADRLFALRDAPE